MAATRKIGYKRILIAVVVLGGLLGLWQVFYGQNNKAVTKSKEATYTLKRQDMVISVTESGSIKASNAVTIRSDVEGRTTIVNVVPEGTILTEQDVAEGKVILELDTSSIKQDLNQQQIQYNSAMADLTDAKENLEIQKNQNESDIQQGKLTVKFGLMDLQKYLGQYAADKLVADASSRSVTDEDFKKLTEDPNQLGGEALQTYRQLIADMNVAESEYYIAQNTYNWTDKLYAKNYVAKTDLESDKLKADKCKITQERAQTALDLFFQYEFPKEAHKLFSDYIEAQRQLERILAKARSQEAQAVAKLSSADAKFALEKERLERYQRQIAASVIKAPCPGLVVYATQFSRGSRSRTSIEVGREVYEREEIMSIPNTTQMAVDTKIHETNVDKIALGQMARITVDAMPDNMFYGQVTKISPLPDQAGFMSNPDLKIYSTDVALQGGEMLRPGMSAKVEIIIAQLKDVLAVPVQCISNRSGKKFCYIHTLAGNEPREVQTGPYNDKFVQIVSGLNEGDAVLLNPPRVFDQQQGTPIPENLPEMPNLLPVNGQTQQRTNGGFTQPDTQNRPAGFPAQGESPQNGQNQTGRRWPGGQESAPGQQPNGAQPGTPGTDRPARQRPEGMGLDRIQQNNTAGSSMAPANRPQGQQRGQQNTETTPAQTQIRP
ncbi:MAG: efflux RND transporter periplasmic adaptor subunit [Sedimentisphaerales bacterium]|nr:efflux RND transporter periplasmic adaptor subunit [Sedimentisphaerales bacterium]